MLAAISIIWFVSTLIVGVLCLNAPIRNDLE